MRVRPLLQCLQLACSSLCSFSFGSEFRKKLPPHPTMHSHCKGMHVTIGSCSPSTSCVAHRPAMAWNKNVDGGKVMARHNDKVCSTHHDKAVSCSSTKAWLMAAKAKRQLCLERINKPHGPCRCTPLIPFRGSVVISRMII